MSRDAHAAVGQVWCDEGEHWIYKEFATFLGQDDRGNEVWICDDCEYAREDSEMGY